MLTSKLIIQHLLSVDTVIAVILVLILVFKPSEVYTLNSSMIGRAILIAATLVLLQRNVVVSILSVLVALDCFTNFREGMDHDGATDGDGETPADADGATDDDGATDGDADADADGEAPASADTPAENQQNEADEGTDNAVDEEAEDMTLTPTPPSNAPPAIPATDASPATQATVAPPEGVTDAPSFRKKFCNRDNILIKDDSAVCLSSVPAEFPYLQFSREACDPCKSTCTFSIRDRVSGEEKLRPVRSASTSDDPVAVQMNQ